MKLFRKRTQDDASFLEEVVSLWSMVQAENTAHKKYVNDIQWKQWVKVDSDVSEDLNTIIDNFDGSLTEDAVTRLNDISRMVKNAKRMTEKELINERFVEPPVDESVEKFKMSLRNMLQ